MLRQNRKALLIGAGSGRDMASALLLLDGIRKKGFEVDLAGFLTPWALHRFEGQLEEPVNDLSKDSVKFIPGKEYLPLKSYFEPELVHSIRKHDLAIDKTYAFSLQHGTDALSQGIQQIVETNGYDLIVAVDVGGDILARKQDLQYVYTPIVDLSCLEILSKLLIEVHLAVVSPGIDGELPLPVLREILDGLAGQVKAVLDIEGESQMFADFKAIKEDLDKISTSHTGDILVRIIEERPKDNLQETYVKRYGPYAYSYRVELAREFFNKIFFFDLKKVKDMRREIEITFGNIAEAFKHLKELGAGGTEVDFSFVASIIDSKNYSGVRFIHSCLERIPFALKEKILEYESYEVATR